MTVYETNIGGSWRSSDDLTLDELESLETATDVPWAFFNPHRSIKCARALITVWLARDGKTDDEIKAVLDKVTARVVKGLFRTAEDDDLPVEWVDGLPVVDPKADGSTGT